MLSRSAVPLATVLVVMSGCVLAALPRPALAASSAPSAGTARVASMPTVGPPDLASEWWLTSLGVPQAWKAADGARPGAGVTVAVLSTGADAAHPDLAGDVTTGPDYSGSGAGPGDPYWGPEGTAVASLIAGHGHGTRDLIGTGSQGITGVAPGAKILSLRVTLEYNDPRNSNPAITRALSNAIAAGIRYAVSHGASVIALPLDPGTLGPQATGDPVASGGSAAEQAAVRAALAANVVLLAPAGDNAASTRTVNYPAAYPGVIAVGATDQNGQLESFSSRRAYVALTAPGGGLTVAAPGGGYVTIRTTDMAAALTAGVAALIRSRYPHLSAAQVARALVQGTPPLRAGIPGTGAGPLSAARALTAAAAIAGARPAPAGSRPGAASPAPQATGTAQAGRSSAQSGQSLVTSPQSGLSRTARSILRDLAIGAGVLILLLAGLLMLARSRRRQARAERLGYDLSQSRRTGGLPAITSGPASPRSGTIVVPGAAGLSAVRRTGGFQALSSHGAHAAQRGGTGSQPAIGAGPSHAARGGRTARGATERRAISAGPEPARTATGGALPGGALNGGLPAGSTLGGGTLAAGGGARPRPRTAQLPRNGSLGSMGRPVRPDRPYAIQPLPRPPWEQSDGPRPAGALTAGSQADPGTAGSLAAPTPSDLPYKRTNTGPMYVWNPATNSGPFPVVTDDES